MGEGLMDIGIEAAQCKPQEPRGIIRPVNPTSEKRTLVIKPAMNGYMVEVGCRIVVFETAEKMLGELKRYLDNPQTVEREYLEKHK
jgi:hypothetical protein